MTMTTAAQGMHDTVGAAPASKTGDPEQALNRAIEELRGITARADTMNAVSSHESSFTNAAALQIPLEATVVIGSAEITLAELSVLKIGATLKLDRAVGGPLDLVVNGIRIAKGELIISDKQANKLSFRISSVIS